MGLKEILPSVNDKVLMTSLFVAEGLDILTTGAGFHAAATMPGRFAAEVNPLGGQEILKNVELTEAFILKTAVTAIRIGTYALASNHDLKLKIGSTELKSRYVFPRAFIGANIFAWGVVAWNALQLSKMA